MTNDMGNNSDINNISSQLTVLKEEIKKSDISTLVKTLKDIKFFGEIYDNIKEFLQLSS